MVCVAAPRQFGHSFLELAMISAAQRSHTQKWPQGTNACVLTSSMHTTHSLPAIANSPWPDNAGGGDGERGGKTGGICSGAGAGASGAF